MVGGRLKREEIYVYLWLIHAEEQNYVKQSSFNKNDLKKKKKKKKKQELEPDIGQWTVSKLEKEYVQYIVTLLI